jgi:hypothetical protein
VSEDIKKPVGGGPVTFINIFEVPVEQIDAFIAQWRERAKIMSTAPGFHHSRLHRALSSRTRFQIVRTSPTTGTADRRGKPPRRTRSFKPACVLWP